MNTEYRRTRKTDTCSHGLLGKRSVTGGAGIPPAWRARRSPVILLGLVFLVSLFLFSGRSAMTQRRPAPAFVPIVGDRLLLGGVQNGRWLSSEKARGLVKGGEKYRFYTLSGFMYAAKGEKPEESEHGNAWYIPLFTEKELEANPPDIGSAGDWNPLPRVPREEDTRQKVYLDAVAEVLREKGLPHAKPHIRKIMRVDLEGKGVDSVIIDAASPDKYGEGRVHAADTNSYSFVLLRTLVRGKLWSHVLDGEFYKKPPHPMGVNGYQLLAVLDLNGDGTMEIVTYGESHEGFDFTVYQLTNGNMKMALRAGDGA